MGSCGSPDVVSTFKGVYCINGRRFYIVFSVADVILLLECTGPKCG
jgi:hypothetical protein